MPATPEPGSSTRTAAAFQRAQSEARVRSSGVGIPAYPAQPLPRSGTMPDASGQVLCPHCHKGFRFSLGLLNRQIRCNGCHGVFRVSEDRRTFKLQPPPAVVEPQQKDADDISRTTRVALQRANDDLNATARKALRELDRKGGQVPARQPISSESLIPLVKPTPGEPPASSKPVTGRIAKRKDGAALSGSGVEAGRSRAWWLTALIVAAILALGAMLVLGNEDPRLAALSAYQSASRLDQTWNERLAELRMRSLGGRVEPIVGFDGAILGSQQPVTLDGLRQALTGMRSLVRGELWVESTRHGEAVALLGGSSAPTPAFLNACRKAAITVRTWDEAISTASGGAGQPAGAAEVLRLLLDRPQPRGDAFDPIAVLDRGLLPKAMAIVPFSGQGQLLQMQGPPKAAAYHGWLVRIDGDGWPDRWLVLDVR